MGYSAEEKFEIIMEANQKNTSKEAVADKYGISRQALHTWEKKLEKGASKTLKDKKAGRRKEDEVESLEEAQEKLKELQQEKKELKSKLKKAEKEKLLSEIHRDFIKFSLTEDEYLDPDLREKNQEILKKTDILPDKSDGS